MPPRNAKQASTPKPTEQKTDDKKRVQKQYAPVSLADLKPVKLAAKDKVTVIPGRERSAEQKAVDATVRELAFEYLAAGSPKQFRDMPVVSYTLPTDQAATVRFMLNKACNLLNCKPKFGRQAWDEGNEVVSFCPIPRDPSQWTDDKKEPTTADDKPADDKPADDKPADDKPADDKPADDKAKGKTDPSEFLKDE